MAEAKPARRTLLLDSATPTLMAAVAIEGEICARVCEESSSQRYHSAVLTARIDAMLRSLSLTPRDLTALAVNVGPGSFTGLRTGLTTARVMGQFLPLTCYAFSAFDLLLNAPEAPVALALDALQGRAYTAIRDAAGGWLQPPALRALAEWRAVLPPEMRLLGSESLRGALEGAGAFESVESAGRFTPEAMLSLMAQGATPVSWEALLPLYLQAPNITVGKPRSRGSSTH